MKKLSKICLVALVILSLAMVANFAHCKDVYAPGDIVIDTKPPSNAIIVDSGIGNIHMGSNFASFNHVNWAVTNNGIIYEWVEDGSTPDPNSDTSIPADLTLLYAAIAVVVIVIVMLAALILMRRR
jgi:hypothetical protein